MSGGAAAEGLFCLKSIYGDGARVEKGNTHPKARRARGSPPFRCSACVLGFESGPRVYDAIYIDAGAAGTATRRSPRWRPSPARRRNGPTPRAGARAVAAVLVGCNLAVSGTLLQAVTRNPLADPGLIGVTAGAALAATWKNISKNIRRASPFPNRRSRD